MDAYQIGFGAGILGLIIYCIGYYLGDSNAQKDRKELEECWRLNDLEAKVKALEAKGLKK